MLEKDSIALENDSIVLENGMAAVLLLIRITISKSREAVVGGTN